MTLPLTPQLDRPIKSFTAAKTMSTQLFGVLYITLTGMVDSMVPNSGPWSFLGQSHPSYGGHYPLARQYPVLSHLMPLPMPGFLTTGVDFKLKKLMVWLVLSSGETSLVSA
ncbi:hypothetical protein DSO57_1006660 [Entomophthora muscae]|uniref:Uncharacterized protein n=1 Tax=Entomophthora muscae TaxID=34485 RepID=A0ACC2SWS5_9FUNG|nr:hypothetical protein DSO57_1006660 [Entomophthora muscae]